VVQREWIKYKIKVSQDDLPACPNCRQLPSQNTIEISVLDRFQYSDRYAGADITLVPSSK
jgi:hypothetical protein